MVNLWRWAKDAVRPRQPSTIQRDEVGPYLYRFHDPGSPANICIISAHGSEAETLHAPMGLGHENVRLIFYVTHGLILRQEGSSLEPFMDSSATIAEVSDPNVSPDYILRKYTNSNNNKGLFHQKHNTAGESYNSVKIDIALRRAINAINIDVITIRNNKGAAILLSDVLRFVWNNGLEYDEIRCAFCRWDGARTPRGSTPTPSA